MNSDKCHLFISGHKFEHLWAKISNDKIWETRTSINENKKVFRF